MTEIYFNQTIDDRPIKRLEDLLALHEYEMEMVLRDVIRYHLPYRSHLRKYGVDATLKLLLDECPQLRTRADVVAKVGEYLKSNPISEIADFFYFPDEGCIEGPNFTIEYERLLEASEIIAVLDYDSISKSTDYKPLSNGYHVAAVRLSPPCFDEFDRMYSETFRTFFISKQPFTEERMNELRHIMMKNDKEKWPIDMFPFVKFGSRHTMMLVGVPLSEDVSEGVADGQVEG